MLSHLLYACMVVGYISAKDTVTTTKAPTPPVPTVAPTAAPATKPVDNSCSKDGKFTRQAVSCKNIQPDVFCANFYGATPKEGDANENRNIACYQSNGVASSGVKDGAIATCAQTCGFCCETPEYNCQNSKYDSCDKYSQKQCEDPLWKKELVKLCPATCGLCLEGDCKDLAVECWRQMGVCRSTDKVQLNWAKENCKRTCGFCDLS